MAVGVAFVDSIAAAKCAGAVLFCYGRGILLWIVAIIFILVGSLRAQAPRQAKTRNTTK